ncbi:MAG TPA: NADH-quinone oxidoreductase subunit C, partial [Pyrinomonadaceae bacterium]
MSVDTKQPGSEEPTKPGVSDSEASGTPPPSAIPPAGTLAGADAEKASMVEQAKSRVAAVKESLTEQAAAPGAPKPPVKKKEEGPKPTDASEHALVKKLKAKFGDAIGEASEFIGQLSVYVDGQRIVEVCDFLKSDADASFNYLSDLTCVHYPDRRTEPFEIVYNLFAIEANERVRLKVRTKESVDSVTGVWPSANWLEREVFDLFGVRFNNHPDLRRLLLPPDWEGHPLRKDYPLEFVENAWSAKHLPVMTEVEMEQLQQRR